MNKETVIAYMHAEISISEEFRSYLNQYPDAWFSREGGELFLQEFGHTWNTIYLEALQSFFYAHFHELGISQEHLPKVRLSDSRKGSWIMDAALTMFSTVGSAYIILKAVADLPKIADGLEETKKRLQKELQELFQGKVHEKLEVAVSSVKLDSTKTPKSMPSKAVGVSFSIDARPLRGLTPDKIKSHSIHLAVGISRSAISVENLGETTIQNLRIGLFKSKTERNAWNFGDSFSKDVPILSQKQSISLSVAEFKSQINNETFRLDDDNPLYVDCWLQDNSGIYLFNFYLE